MESIIAHFSALGLNLPTFLKIACILILGSLLFCGIFRFIFRKKTLISHAVSASIAIIFIFMLMVLITVMMKEFVVFTTPLPFVTITEDAVGFFIFSNASYLTIATQLLAMIILAFLVNLVDTILPNGKNFFTWLFWRIVTVGSGFLLHYVITLLLTRYVPQGLALYAPAILLAILILMLLTGALKFLVGLLLTTVNPLIAALYTFFFATVVGKQLTQSVLTTGILTGVILLLEKYDVASMSIANGAMAAYLPFLLILIPVWYFVCKI